ncbi:MAG: reverse transcriptase family protein [Promethearchaeia archaeon]
MDELSFVEIPAGRLEELEKNPLDINKFFHRFSSQDQDLPDYYNAPKNKYLFVHDLPPLNNQFKRLSFWNCRGLNSSLNFLHDFLKGSSTDVLGICETFLDKNNTFQHYENYKFFHASRKQNKRGGVGIFIRDVFASSLRNEFMVWNVEMLFESCVVEVNDGRNTFLVIVVYRPPSSSIQEFLSQYESLLDALTQQHHPFYVMGDFNIDLMRHNVSTSNKGLEFLNISFLHGLSPTCLLPSRICDNHATLIDNIFTSENCLDTHIILNDTSDHCVVVSDFSGSGVEREKRPNKSYKRIINQKKIDEMKVKIGDIDWNDVLNVEDPNQSIVLFYSKFNQIFDQVCPMVLRKSKDLPRKPWVTESLLKSIKEKNRLYKVKMQYPNEINIENFKKYKNRLTLVLREAEAKYYQNEFRKCDSPRETWKLINEKMNNVKTRNIPSHITSHEGVKITDERGMAEAFADHFRKVGHGLVDQISAGTHNHRKYLPNKVDKTIFMYPIRFSEYQKAVTSLKNGFSAGCDGISTSLFKELAGVLFQPLLYIFNSCIKNGFFPVCLKVAKILPLFKKGDKDNPNNYRPITILSPVSKVFEKIIKSRFISFLEKNKFFSPNQFGFLSGRSTEQAVAALHHFLSEAMDDSYLAATIFFDIKKAFDTIDHAILFDKLENIGIRGIALDLMRSYLSERSFKVQVCEESSHIFPLENIGVPQGSVLGPILFLIYVNDLPNCMPSGDELPILFADDTAISLRAGNEEDLRLSLETVALNVNSWFHDNRLIPNLEKSEFMVFGRSSRSVKRVSFQIINIGASSIKRVDLFRYLGIYIDSTLSFKTHISKLKATVSRNLGCLHRLKFLFPYQIIRTLYFSLIDCYFQYCSTVWMLTFPSHLRGLQIVQNKSIRILDHFLAHPRKTEELSEIKTSFLFLDILDLQQILHLNLGIWFLKIQHKDHFFNSMKLLVENKHSLLSRARIKFLFPFVKIERSRLSLRYQLPHIANKYKLFELVSESPSLYIYKKKLKKMVLSAYSSGD